MKKILGLMLFLSMFFFLVGTVSAVTINNMQWTTGGNAPWTFSSNNGLVNGYSGDIGDNQQSWIEATAYGPGTLYYEFKTSSEASYSFYSGWRYYDYLALYHNNILSQKHGGSSYGDVKTHLTSNSVHVFRWAYVKDSSKSYGDDTVWISNVKWISDDKTNPIIKKINPKNKAVKVSRTQKIIVTFSEPIKAGTYKIILKSNKGKVKIYKSINGQILTIKHRKLSKKTRYSLIIYGGSIKDLNGNPILLKTFKFTTK